MSVVASGIRTYIDLYIDEESSSNTPYDDRSLRSIYANDISHVLLRLLLSYPIFRINNYETNIKTYLKL